MTTNALSINTETNATHEIAPNQIKRVIAGTALACLALSTCIATAETKAEGSTTPVVPSNHTMVLAQSNTQETDGKIYTAEVIQIDGSKKVVTYHRDIRGVIIAPPVTDGKLVDGSEAPNNPVEARVAQKKILVKYDKNAQIMIASVSKEDIFGKADKSLKEILAFTEQGEIITKEQLIDGFYSTYILILAVGESSGKGQKTISGLESIARMKMNMNESEISQIKRDTQIKAKAIWKSVSGAVA